MYFRETLVFMQDQSADSLVFIVFRQMEPEVFIGLFKASALFIFADFLGDGGCGVVLVFDISQNFLNQILQGHNA